MSRSKKCASTGTAHGMCAAPSRADPWRQRWVRPDLRLFVTPADFNVAFKECLHPRVVVLVDGGIPRSNFRDLQSYILLHISRLQKLALISQTRW